MSLVFQNIDPPIPLTAQRVCTPRLWCEGRTLSLGGERGGGSIFWKTGDTALYSTYVSTFWSCGSVTFWYVPRTSGSGSGSGSCYFSPWPSRRQQKTIFLFKIFLLITLRRYIYIIFLRQKVTKKSQNSRNQGFFYYFCLMIKVSRSGSGPLTNGSGSRRPKNIRNIRILRIWILCWQNNQKHYNQWFYQNKMNLYTIFYEIF
jgi:hypothetical protein